MFSKTNYTDGVQCPKMLWMQLNMPEAREEDAVRQDLLDAGHEIGELARVWSGSHVVIEQDYDYARMADETRSHLENGETVCEATFVYDDFVCMVDICKPLENGSLELYEVKASTKVKPYHVDDLSFQVMVVAGCGYDIASASIVRLDGDYRLDGALDLDALFAVEDMTDTCAKRAKGIPYAVAEMLYTRNSDVEPDIVIGKQCNSPHACPFQGWCWRHVPKDSVFSLAGIGKVRGLKHWNEGRRTYSDMLSMSDGGSVKLNGFQRAQANGEIHVDTDSVKGFLDTLRYPLYFLDFETVQPPIPVYQGTKVYQQIPTQFSLHWVDEPGGELHHDEYLAPSTGDPREGVAEALVKAIPAGACVTAYNMSFEKGRIKELAGLLPGYADDLMAIHDAVVDLMKPFQKGWVYLPAMGGSYSIKKVLPALFPDDSELDYGVLEGVHNGAEAMSAFAALSDMDAETESMVREQLLRYCELDTLAMVKVWEWLEQHARA